MTFNYSKRKTVKIWILVVLWWNIFGLGMFCWCTKWRKTWGENSGCTRIFMSSNKFRDNRRFLCQIARHGKRWDPKSREGLPHYSESLAFLSRGVEPAPSHQTMFQVCKLILLLTTWISMHSRSFHLLIFFIFYNSITFQGQKYSNKGTFCLVSELMSIHLK